MKQRFIFTRIFTGLSLLALLVITACTDPITVGSELLEEDRASVGFNGSLDLVTRTVQEDSARVFDEESNRSTNIALFGSIEDPVFGTSQSGLYLIPDLPRGLSGLIVVPDFAGEGSDSVTIDSIVLILPYDTSTFYGTVLLNSFPYQVSEIIDFVDLDQDIYSNQVFSTAATPLATGTFQAAQTPALLHDTTAMRYDSVLLQHVRIPLDMSLIDRFNNADTTIYNSDTLFRDFFQGLFLQTNGLSNSILPINVDELTGSIGLLVYTSQDNDNYDFYRIPFELAAPNYAYDYSGSIAETRLSQPVNNEQLLLQGASGLMTEIEIINLDDFPNKVINYAELNITLESIPSYNYVAYPAAQRVALYFRNSDGFLQQIADAGTLVSGTGAESQQFFLGGDLERDEDSAGRQFYRLNLSVHLQDMLSGDVPTQIYVRVSPIDSDPGRSILYGPEHPDFPMTLKIAFTEF